MKFVSARAFKAAVKRDRKSASDMLVRKLLVGEPVVSDDQELVRFTITTAGIDRDMDVVSLDGWELDNYRRNPVVLWGHEAWEPPIGRSMNLIREADALKSDVRFVPEDVPIFGPKAEGIKQLCRRGFLFATSVGFRPLEWDFTDDESRGADEWFPGVDFQRQELMEFSICSIPANPEALIEQPGTVGAAASADTPQRQTGAEAAAAEAAAALARIKRERARRQRIGRLFAD